MSSADHTGRLLRMYEKRSYRQAFDLKDLLTYEVKLVTTDLFIASVTNRSDEVFEKIRSLRNDILSYSAGDPGFLSSLVPVEIYKEAPYIVKRMAEAAIKADVGPMAAVAGGISEIIGDMLTKDDSEALVENGGDIFAYLKHDLIFSVFSGKNSIFSDLRIKIVSEHMPVGICTSSGRIGPSLSFGDADAACVISKDVFLADACATKAANMVKCEEDIEKALDFTRAVNGVTGAVIIRDDKIGLWGNISII